MTLRIEAREAVGYTATWTIGQAGVPVDISGWTFEATFERQAGAPDFSLGMAVALDPEVEGFTVFNGPAGQLAVNILPATLQGIDDTTGLFELDADLLGTPPAGPRQFVKAIVATITKGPTE